MYKKYTGIGSRKIPKEKQDQLSKIALILEKKGYQVYTGDAHGSDESFRVVKNKKVFTAKDCTVESMEIAKRIHPSWERCSSFARKLLGRNPLQLLGYDLKSPTSFVVAYTPQGTIKGGSSIVLNLAKENNIPVFNIGNEEELKKLIKFLKTL